MKTLPATKLPKNVKAPSAGCCESLLFIIITKHEAMLGRVRLFMYPLVDSILRINFAGGGVFTRAVGTELRFRLRFLFSIFLFSNEGKLAVAFNPENTVFPQL